VLYAGIRGAGLACRSPCLPMAAGDRETVPPKASIGVLFRSTVLPACVESRPCHLVRRFVSQKTALSEHEGEVCR
jgi:hypothetical protein